MLTAADTVRISVLGPLEVTDAAGRRVPVGGHRVRALFILLALEAGRTVPARALIERLWADGRERPADAANALQSLVSRLRVALRQAGLGDGVLESAPAGYRLAIAPEAVDAIGFAARVRAGSQALARGDAGSAASLLRPALAAWRGPALADVAGEEFACAPAARLEELRKAALLDRIDADLMLGTNVATLTSELRELTAADPLAERPAALLMRALAVEGRQAEALDVYASTRALLAGRLGVDPSPQLERMHLAVLRQEISVPAAQPGAPRIPPPARPVSDGGQRPAASEDGERPGGRTPDGGQGEFEAPDGELAAGSPGAGDDDPAAVAAVAGSRSPRGQRPPTSFVGRDEDVARVLKRLAAARLVTLTGPGGVGKTRLASEAAARLAFPAWFAELAPLTNPAEVPYAVLDALGLRERSIARRGAEAAAGPLDRLSAALADREAVLILDNCEHVIDAAAGLAARLLSDCPRIRVLATSREPLRAPGETLFVVAPLPAPPAALVPVSGWVPVPDPFPRPGSVPASGLEFPSAVPASETEPGIAEVSAYPAVRLFADRAAAIILDFALDESNADAVARICRALDGIPLAIELAAPWLRTLTPAQLAERLDDRFSLLTGGSRTALPRHKTLRAVVDWSWNLLSEPERMLARRLAVFPGDATLAAAERVCSLSSSLHGAAGLTAGRDQAPASGLPRAAVLPALAGLVDKSILTAIDSPGGEPTYRMLDTVRAYGLERLAEGGEEAQVKDAFAAYYLGFAEAADPLLRTADQARWFRELTRKQDNLLAALRWAIARRDAETALRFVRALGYYWVQRGHGEADMLCREVLALPPPPLTRQIAEARVICALLAAGWSWDIESVRQPLTAAIASLARYGNDYDSFHPLVAMAEPLILQYDGATDRAQQQFERYVAVNDPWKRGVSRVNLASYAYSLGRFDGAEDHCRAALAELRPLGENWGVAVALTLLAEFTELRGDHAASIAALTEADKIGRELGVWGDLTYVAAKLAVIQARAGNIARARAGLAQVQRTLRERGGSVDTDRWVDFMGAEIAWLAGDYAEAAERCLAVLTGIRELRARWWESLRATAKARLAMTLLKRGGAPQCGQLLAEALDAAAAWCEHPSLAAVLDACAAYALSRGVPGQAGVAARLLGAAHAIRGAFDESSPDAPAARGAARDALGAAAFDAAYRSARDLGYEAAIALARDALTG